MMEELELFHCVRHGGDSAALCEARDRWTGAGGVGDAVVESFASWRCRRRTTCARVVACSRQGRGGGTRLAGDCGGLLVVQERIEWIEKEEEER